RHALSISAPAADANIQPQQACDWYMCPNGSQSTGDYPDCFCGIYPLELPGPTCETETTCPPGLVAVGTWPTCTCVTPDDGVLPVPIDPGWGPSPDTFNPGLGGVDVCNQFFTCPNPDMRMETSEGGDSCLCK